MADIAERALTKIRKYGRSAARCPTPFDFPYPVPWGGDLVRRERQQLAELRQAPPQPVPRDAAADGKQLERRGLRLPVPRPSRRYASQIRRANRAWRDDRASAIGPEPDAVRRPVLGARRHRHRRLRHDEWQATTRSPLPTPVAAYTRRSGSGKREPDERRAVSVSS